MVHHVMLELLKSWWRRARVLSHVDKSLGAREKSVIQPSKQVTLKKLEQRD